ncbi:AEC family transporter [Occultella glacieicola]|uniref:AEC family transporter n=1 Tax=Occultella glacieicola TaxID=2518684 RepID=A0ABY2E2E2_9MICO|nr:AEC family transporter [Occultella glacieicola]TDE91677.1 AEC family transporter [Occultella glacieicola]
MSGILVALGTMTVIAVIGWILGTAKVLGANAQLVLAKLVFTVATPSLLLTTIAETDLGLLFTTSALTTVVSTLAVAVIGGVVFRLVLHRGTGESTVGALSSSYLNAGNLGLPLAVYVLGTAVPVVPVLLVQLLVLAPVAFAILDTRPAGSASRRQLILRPLTNPVTIAAAIGIVLAVLPWSPPDFVLEPFRLVGAAAAPLALITLGLSLVGSKKGSGAAERPVAGRAPMPDLVVVTTLRAVVHPLLAFGLAAAFSLDHEAALGVVLMAALPTAQNVLVYALQYGQGQAIARDAQLVTTVLSLPVMIAVVALLH